MPAIVAVAAIMATSMCNAPFSLMLVLIVLPTVCTVIFVTVRACHLTALNGAITSVAMLVNFVRDDIFVINETFVIYHCLVTRTGPSRYIEIVGPISCPRILRSS